jgi:antitoxin (DNA-binding transcriptional repressor) of toxin-antitoxin stability system
MPEEPNDERVVTLSYARTHLHALIREVQAGQVVHIRRRDGRSATLVPYRSDPEKAKP